MMPSDCALILRCRMVKKSSRRVNRVQLVTSVFRRTLFCVGEQVDASEHFGIDLLAELIQPPLLIRRESNRSVPVAPKHCGLPLDPFRVQPFDLALLTTADPGRKPPLEPAAQEAALQAAVR